MRGLYPIIDLDTLQRTGFSATDFADQVLLTRPPLLQLRAKSSPARETLALLRALLPRCRRAGTLLFANDRPDLAVLAGVDGVHVGQDDLPVAQVRQLAPNLRVGVSTHDPGQLDAALADAPDYVAYGPVFATASKKNPDPVVGLAGLAHAAARARERGTPLVAIGGIDLERAPAVAAHGALGAIIGALVGPTLDDVARRARALHAALGGT